MTVMPVSNGMITLIQLNIFNNIICQEWKAYSQAYFYYNFCSGGLLLLTKSSNYTQLHTLPLKHIILLISC